VKLFNENGQATDDFYWNIIRPAMGVVPATVAGIVLAATGFWPGYLLIVLGLAVGTLFTVRVVRGVRQAKVGDGTTRE